MYIIAAINGNNDNILVNVYIDTHIYIKINIIKNKIFDNFLFFSFNTINESLAIAINLVMQPLYAPNKK